MHEIERLKAHRKSLTVAKPIPVAVFT